MAAAAAIQSLAGKGLENGQFRDLDREHPELDRFKRMQKAGLPQGAIENAMVRVYVQTFFFGEEILPKVPRTVKRN